MKIIFYSFASTLINLNLAYRFFMLKSDVLELNTIVETKIAEFFEHIFPLRVSVERT